MIYLLKNALKLYKYTHRGGTIDMHIQYSDKVFRFPEASKHQFIIEYMIEPISVSYAKNRKPLQFLIDVMAINVKNFLSGSSDEDRRVQQKFQATLSTYCGKYHLSQRIPEVFGAPKVKVLKIMIFESLTINNNCLETACNWLK